LNLRTVAFKVAIVIMLLLSRLIYSGLTSTEIYSLGWNSSVQVASSQPAILVRPSAVFIGSSVLLFGGTVFGTQNPNSNVYKFDLTTNLWSTMETALQNSFGIVSSDFKLEYFTQTGSYLSFIIKVEATYR